MTASATAWLVRLNCAESEKVYSDNMADLILRYNIQEVHSL